MNPSSLGQNGIHQTPTKCFTYLYHPSHEVGINTITILQARKLSVKGIQVTKISQ